MPSGFQVFQPTHLIQGSSRDTNVVVQINYIPILAYPTAGRRSIELGWPSSLMGTSFSNRAVVPFIGKSVGMLGSLSLCRFHSPFLSRGIGLEILTPRTDFWVDGGDGFKGSTSFPLASDCCDVCSCKSCRGSNPNPIKYAVGIIYGAKGRSG